MLLLINAEEWDGENKEYTGNCLWKAYRWKSVPSEGQTVSIGGNGYIVDIVSHELDHDTRPHVEVCIQVDIGDFETFIKPNKTWSDDPRKALRRAWWLFPW